MSWYVWTWHLDNALLAVECGEMPETMTVPQVVKDYTEVGQFCSLDFIVLNVDEEIAQRVTANLRKLVV